MAILIACLAFGGFTAAIAVSKGRSGFGWFVLGALFWILALIAVIAMPRGDRTN